MGGEHSSKGIRGRKADPNKPQNLIFIKGALSSASISSVLLMSFTVETHNDNGGVVAVFQYNEMRCRAADRKKNREGIIFVKP